jgi:hypothetical protein
VLENHDAKVEDKEKRSSLPPKIKQRQPAEESMTLSKLSTKAARKDRSPPYTGTQDLRDFHLAH